MCLPPPHVHQQFSECHHEQLDEHRHVHQHVHQQFSEYHHEQLDECRHVDQHVHQQFSDQTGVMGKSGQSANSGKNEKKKSRKRDKIRRNESAAKGSAKLTTASFAGARKRARDQENTVWEAQSISKRRVVQAHQVPSLKHHDYSATGSHYNPASRAKTEEFRVRWKGFRPSDDTWEPRGNINTALFQAFALGKDKYPDEAPSVADALAIPDTDPGYLLKEEFRTAAAVSAIDAPRQRGATLTKKANNANTAEKSAANEPDANASIVLMQPGSTAPCSPDTAGDDAGADTRQEGKEGKGKKKKRANYKSLAIPTWWADEAVALCGQLEKMSGLADRALRTTNLTEQRELKACIDVLVAAAPLRNNRHLRDRAFPGKREGVTVSGLRSQSMFPRVPLDERPGSQVIEIRGPADGDANPGVGSWRCTICSLYPNAQEKTGRHLLEKSQRAKSIDHA